LRLLTRLKLDPARLELITGFFETYLKLNQQEEEQLSQALGKINQKNKCWGSGLEISLFFFAS